MAASTFSSAALCLATAAALCCRWASVSSPPGGRWCGGHPITRAEVDRGSVRAIEAEWVIAHDGNLRQPEQRTGPRGHRRRSQARSRNERCSGHSVMSRADRGTSGEGERSYGRPVPETVSCAHGRQKALEAPARPGSRPDTSCRAAYGAPRSSGSRSPRGAGWESRWRPRPRWPLGEIRRHRNRDIRQDVPEGGWPRSRRASAEVVDEVRAVALQMARLRVSSRCAEWPARGPKGPFVLSRSSAARPRRGRGPSGAAPRGDARPTRGVLRRRAGCALRRRARCAGRKPRPPTQRSSKPRDSSPSDTSSLPKGRRQCGRSQCPRWRGGE